jgi:hypothetical protein
MFTATRRSAGSETNLAGTISPGRSTSGIDVEAERCPGPAFLRAGHVAPVGDRLAEPPAPCVASGKKSTHE